MHGWGLKRKAFKLHSTYLRNKYVWMTIILVFLGFAHWNQT